MPHERPPPGSEAAAVAEVTYNNDGNNGSNSSKAFDMCRSIMDDNNNNNSNNSSKAFDMCRSIMDNNNNNNSNNNNRRAPRVRGRGAGRRARPQKSADENGRIYTNRLVRVTVTVDCNVSLILMCAYSTE